MAGKDDGRAQQGGGAALLAHGWRVGDRVRLIADVLRHSHAPGVARAVGALHGRRRGRCPHALGGPGSRLGLRHGGHGRHDVLVLSPDLGQQKRPMCPHDRRTRRCCPSCAGSSNGVRGRVQ